MLSAIMLVMSLVTLLPDGAVRASAEKSLNIRVSYNAEKGQIHLEWDAYADDVGYTIDFFNDYASGPNAGQMLPMEGTNGGSVKVGGAPEFTTVEGFGALYGNGGMNYQVRIKAVNLNGVLHEEFSEVFRTGVPILSAPKNVSFYSNGLITWEREHNAWAAVNIYDQESGERVIHAETPGHYYDDISYSDKVQTGKSYYASVKLMIGRPDYSYRQSETVYSNAAVYENPTGILGLGWDGWNVHWARYPKCRYYRVALQKQDPGGGFTDVEVMQVYKGASTEDNSTIIEKDMFPYIEKYGSGVYRVVIWSLNSFQGDQVSYTTVTDEVTYTEPPSKLVGDINTDGSITADDAIIAARLAAGYGDYSARYDSDIADMNRDGKVTADDAIIIARYAADYGNYKDIYTRYI